LFCLILGSSSCGCSDTSRRFPFGDQRAELHLAWKNVVKEISRNGNMWKAVRVLALKQIPLGTRGAEDVIDSCEDISVMMQGNLKGQDIIRGENNA
jgi:hypothetical protein